MLNDFPTSIRRNLSSPPALPSLSEDIAVDDEVLGTTANNGKERYLEILVFDVITDQVEKFSAKTELAYLVGGAP